MRRSKKGFFNKTKKERAIESVKAKNKSLGKSLKKEKMIEKIYGEQKKKSSTLSKEIEEIKIMNEEEAKKCYWSLLLECQSINKLRQKKQLVLKFITPKKD